MADMSFAVNYTKTKTTPPARAIEYEKCFLTLPAALNFCVQVVDFGGEVQYVIQYIRGTEDAILEGEQLMKAISGHRVRIAAA